MFRKAQLLNQIQKACQAAVMDAIPECSSSTVNMLASRCNQHLPVRGVSSSSGPPGANSSTPRAAAATESTSGTSSIDTPLSVFARQQERLAAMPLYPKLLGFAGAIPFTTLTPAFVQQAGFPEMVDYCAHMQLVYAGSIVSFLGAVHWGLAMSSSTVAAAGTRAAGALNERYVWSVVPSLGVVPALMMQPAQGSLAISVLLAICYLSDSSYFRLGYLPGWYMSLRGYLTLLAIVSMLCTTAHYVMRDVERARKLMEEEEAKRVVRLEARASGGLAAAIAAAETPGHAAHQQEGLTRK